jgi:hypothetical protein
VDRIAPVPGRQRKMPSSELGGGSSSAKVHRVNCRQRKTPSSELCRRVFQRKMAPSELSPAQNGFE